MSFAPIAIVGRACLLPGADSPEALWQLVASGRVVVDAAPEGRWDVDRERIRRSPDSDGADGSWSDRGGYVRGWDAAAAGLGELSALDEVALWSLHVAGQALADSESKGGAFDRSRTGAIFGNLSFPTAGMARYAAESWFAPEQTSEAAFNRFNSSGPAHLLASQLGLGGNSYCLDAACASALYAIRLACDELHAGHADFMLAGAVNKTDDLFIHVGFCALQAMSRSGQSRPFHKDADGLVPAEGAAFVGLMRLDDALRQGRKIHGVIRGVGLSNDGRGRGLLSPMAEGQARAMRAAYEMSGVSPAQISLLECHATGTSVGDAIEIESSQSVFGNTPRSEKLPLGSLKSNMGHLITSAGAAGLIKVLEAFKHEQRPPTAGFVGNESHTHQHPALGNSTFRLLHAPEAWPVEPGQARAAGVSAFGFGGNNAHLVVEQYEPRVHGILAQQAPRPRAPSGGLAVVGLAGQLGSVHGPQAFAREIGDDLARTEQVSVSLKGLKFPPKDLDAALGQQTLSLQLAREALADAGIEVPRERIGVFMGMEADPEVARYGARWRLPELVARYGLDPQQSAAHIDDIVPLLRSAGVLGTMPNIPANRISSQLDAAGPGFTISAGAHSGLAALDIATSMLRRGELDAAIVGAVDLSHEAVHQRACAALGDERPPMDAAAVWVLVREQDAPAAYASLHPQPQRFEAEGTQRNAGAASGLVQATRHLVAVGQQPGAQGALPGTREAAIAPVQARPLTGTSLPGPTLDLPAHPGPVPRFVAAAQTTAAPAAPKPVAAPAAAPVAPAPASAPEAQGSTFMSYDEMPKAPALPAPSTLQDPNTVAQAQQPWIQPTAPVAPATPAAAPVSHAPAPAMPVAAPAPGMPTDPAMALHFEHARRLGEAQQAFMQAQAELHQRFLQMRQQADFALMSGMQPGALPVTATPAPAPVAPAPAQPQVVARAPQPAAQPVPAPVAKPAPPPKPVPTPAPVASKPAAPKAKTTLKPKLAAKPKPAPKPAAPVSKSNKPKPTGLQLNFEQLKIHASGNISEIYGPEFKDQDQYARQVRMPEPPLLLAHRVTGIDAPKAKLGKGTIWTESDVRWDDPYLHAGRMPAGIMIESGQADLMLISYMGIDLLNKGERVYRLLGCELTYHGEMPQPGETLQYDIHLDGHANQGDIRLMFFHYDCEVNGEPRLTVRQGQAGFFTDEELADSAGCLWTPEEQDIVPNPRLAEPLHRPPTKGLTKEQLIAFSEGRTWECFGDDYDFCKTHTRTPRIADGKMLFIDRVTDLVTHKQEGGPWKRGYLRAEADLTPEHWFFEGHFKNDPCMPGTLMFEGCLQTMAIYMASMGFTTKRDGYRFAPVTGEPFALQCRGQATPEAKNLVYEVFVEEVIEGGEPTLYADLLVTIDGLKAFHARRVGLRLVPDWPLHGNEHLEALKHLDENAAVSSEGHKFGQHSLLACAWGKPSAAFGPIYERFDGPTRVARLPGPPYLFMTRVTKVDGPLGGLKVGSKVEVEYDIPEDAWYFDENGYRTMPFAVLLEAALQPCGWLASYIGSALTTEKELVFRNLDGTGDLKVDLLEDIGTITTRVELTKLSQSGGMIIVGFDVDMLDEKGRTLYVMDTVFGFFPPAAMENQIGLPTSEEQRAQLTEPCDISVDLTQRRGKLFLPERAKLAEPMLLMLDRVTAIWPQGGEFGKGRLRGEKDVDKDEWFFKAHFYQDPVQPGSLGIEAMAQLLQVYMLAAGMDEGIPNPRFEPIELGRPMTWKYRGQVIPTNKTINSTLDIVDFGKDERGPWVVGNCSLWVDGKRIYEAKNFGMRIVAGNGLGGRQSHGSTSGSQLTEAGDDTPSGHSEPVQATEETELKLGRVHVLDPYAEDGAWIGDHCPTYTVPALPMMSMLDYIAQHRSHNLPEGEFVTGLRDVRLKGWCIIDEPCRLATADHPSGKPGEVMLLQESGEGWKEIATARVLTGAYPPAPEAINSLTGEPESTSPYLDGRLFHGPAFQVLRELILTPEGASAQLSAASGVPVGALNPGLLDGATHAIQHDELTIWHPKASEEKVAYPAWIPGIEFFSKPPTTGQVECEVRPAGTMGSPDFLAYTVELITEQGVWCRFKLVEAAFPKGPIGMAPRLARRAFLHDRKYALGVGLSAIIEEPLQTRLSQEEVDASDWLPGTIEALYGTREAIDIAAAEHVALHHELHPGILPDALPLHDFELEVSEEDGDFVIEGDGYGTLDLSRVKNFWNGHFGVESWPVADLYYGIVERFLDRVVFEDPEGIAALRGRSVLYLANHQVGIESLIFSIVASGLLELPTRTLAKAEHAESWLGQLIAHAFNYPGIQGPEVIEFFDRSDAKALPGILAKLAAALKQDAHSLMVHVEGTRSRSCIHPVQNMSGAFIELALNSDTPIVPVRFVGALPQEQLPGRLEYPIGMARQSIHFGKPLMPGDLAPMHYKARRDAVIDAINGLAIPNEFELPNEPQMEFIEQLNWWQEHYGVDQTHAVLGTILSQVSSPSEPVKQWQLDPRAAAKNTSDEPLDVWMRELARRFASAD